MPDEVSKRVAALRRRPRRPWPGGSPASGRGRGPAPPRSGARCSAGPAARSLEDHQHVAELDRLARPRPAIRADGPGSRGAELVLHLHRLHDEERLAGLDDVALVTATDGDPPRDDGTDLERATGLARRPAVARRPLAERRARAASSTSNSKRQPSTTTSTARRPCASSRPTSADAGARRVDRAPLRLGVDDDRPHRRRPSRRRRRRHAQRAGRPVVTAATARSPPARPRVPPRSAEAVVFAQRRVRAAVPPTRRRRPSRERPRVGRDLRGALGRRIARSRRPVPVVGRPSRSTVVAGQERRVARQGAVERQGRLDARDLDLVEGAAQPVDRVGRGRPRWTMILAIIGS